MQNFQGWGAGHETSLDKKYFLTMAVINSRFANGPALQVAGGKRLRK
jgi:hypothetical protein